MMPARPKSISVDFTDACYVVEWSTAGFSIHEVEYSSSDTLLDAHRAIQFEIFPARSARLRIPGTWKFCVSISETNSTCASLSVIAFRCVWRTGFTKSASDSNHVSGVGRVSASFIPLDCLGDVIILRRQNKIIPSSEHVARCFAETRVQRTLARCS